MALCYQDETSPLQLHRIMQSQQAVTQALLHSPVNHRWQLYKLHVLWPRQAATHTVNAGAARRGLRHIDVERVWDAGPVWAARPDTVHILQVVTTVKFTVHPCYKDPPSPPLLPPCTVCLGSGGEATHPCTSLHTRSNTVAAGKSIATHTHTHTHTHTQAARYSPYYKWRRCFWQSFSLQCPRHRHLYKINMISEQGDAEKRS